MAILPYPWLVISLLDTEGSGHWSSSLIALTFFVSVAWNGRNMEKLGNRKGQCLLGLACSGT